MDIASAYDRWAETYDTDDNATRDLDAVVLRRALPDPVDRDVLEVGCGTGKNTSWLAERARRVVAMDFSPKMLGVARTRVLDRNVSFIHHNACEAWPFADASFDIVVSDLILEHVADIAPIFTKAARVLRPGGYLFISELHPFRQVRGGQAHFVDAGTRRTVYVPAFVHAVSEYLNVGIMSGFTIEGVGEWRGEGDEDARLFTVLFRR
jgi:ubiquinone/menaquinone biosynthesis C-methylase UbiE